MFLGKIVSEIRPRGCVVLSPGVMPYARVVPGTWYHTVLNYNNHFGQIYIRNGAYIWGQSAMFCLPRHMLVLQHDACSICGCVDCPRCMLYVPGMYVDCPRGATITISIHTCTALSNRKERNENTIRLTFRRRFREVIKKKIGLLCERYTASYMIACAQGCSRMMSQRDSEPCSC